ncbi:phosphate acetyltransferase [Tersicoccus sp. Bi-70]|uniref:phosphate acetyltransferase n=1 Tax=Tersicoccus sp. Bi-70 TaxID=1897634 RepID=UPI000976BA07|nr:phosphate acetyltransferase [Tersicoccus sp. Bi-70]OMH32332.1 phosphate acetyltransferase [Tersicoccus sp. Bi-70]
MARGIYVSAMTQGAGLNLVSLGLADSLYKRADRIGFFRPITPASSPDEDSMVALMRSSFGLTEATARAGMTAKDARALLISGERDEIDSRSVALFGEIARECDIVLVEGTNLSGQDAAVEFDLNSRLANNLGCHVVGVVSGRNRTVEEAVDAVDVARRSLHAENVSILAMLVNRVKAADVDAVTTTVRPGSTRRPVYVIPEIPSLGLPSVVEMERALGLERVTGPEGPARDISDVKVASMEGGNLLSVLDDGTLVIVSGDRSDAILAATASAMTPQFPVPSAMILTNGLTPNPLVTRLLTHAAFPVFLSSADTFTTTRQVVEVQGDLATGQPRKIAAALGAWHRQVDGSELLARLDLPRPEKMTPLRFLHGLIERARSQRRHIVLPEGTDPRILHAAEILHRRDVCDLTLLGPEQDVRDVAAREGVDLTGLTIIDPATSELRERFAAEYARLRAHKGVDVARAREVMLDGSYFGTMMVQLGEVDGMVSGAAHTTANTIRPALEFVKTRPDVRIVSSVFFMLLADRVLVYGDCAVNPEPDEEQLADIALASAQTAAQFGVDPKVAMLSYSTGVSGSGGAVDEVRRATELVRERRPELAVEGPIQYDAAVNASVAASKLPESTVAGQATVFIFPDLNTGNNTYKAVQQSSGAVAVGPVLQGLRKPVNDLSRGCTVEDIVNTVAITAIQGQTDSVPTDATTTTD